MKIIVVYVSKKQNRFSSLDWSAYRVVGYAHNSEFLNIFVHVSWSYLNSKCTSAALHAEARLLLSVLLRIEAQTNAVTSSLIFWLFFLSYSTS